MTLNTPVDSNGPSRDVLAEAMELYTLAARYQRRALSVLTVSDHILTGEALPADQREQSFADMVEIALHSAFD